MNKILSSFSEDPMKEVESFEEWEKSVEEKTKGDYSPDTIKRIERFHLIYKSKYNAMVLKEEYGENYLRDRDIVIANLLIEKLNNELKDICKEIENLNRRIKCAEKSIKEIKIEKNILLIIYFIALIIMLVAK